MYSYLIDCILARHPFPKLGCIWNRVESLIYVAYQIMWAHKYASYYNLICQEFLMPLYQIIFHEELNCLSENAMVVISKYGDYYFSQEGTYIRMYGCSRAPSLFPRYTTDYVVHKEAKRQVFINIIGSCQHDHIKASFPLLPFCIEAYKLSRIKGVEYFVKDLEVDYYFSQERMYIRMYGSS